MARRFPLSISGALVLALLMTFACGCEAQRRRPIGTVSGKVSLQGEPLGADGCVIFCDAAGNTSLMANLAEDGSFTIRSHDEPGLPVGEYRVAISPQLVSPGDPMLVERPDRRVRPKSRIPKRYWEFSTSGLTVLVNEGRNPPLHFELHSL
jgi:hypothetical protein